MYIPRVWILLETPLELEHLSLHFALSLDTAPKLLNLQKKLVLLIMVWTLSKLFKCYQNHFQMKTNLFKVNFTTLGIFKCIFWIKKRFKSLFRTFLCFLTQTKLFSRKRKMDAKLRQQNSAISCLGWFDETKLQIVPKNGLLICK